MYGWLADGDTRRNLTNDDLSLLGQGGGGGPLRGRPRQNIRFQASSVRLLPSVNSYSGRDEDKTDYEAIDELFAVVNTTSDDWLLVLLEQRARDRKSDSLRAVHSPDARSLSNASQSTADVANEKWHTELDVVMSQLDA